MTFFSLSLSLLVGIVCTFHQAEKKNPRKTDSVNKYALSLYYPLVFAKRMNENKQQQKIDATNKNSDKAEQF